ncbi:MAG TPA: L,D-transpeptidase [Methyloceanibacter sp.]|nr:L,D-transpeptidase [Methyloceanibacter sp.]
MATASLAARKRTPSKKPAAKKPAASSKKPADPKHGQFEWHPDRAPSGPLAIIVSLTKQRVYVYRNGIQIGVSTCSTGKKDHETPTGVFTILEKEEEHYSNLYDDAAMPMMQRLTWDGIALHAGKLPGYPASHGCVRLPKAFAEKLYAATQTGTPVIIADAATQPSSVYDPGLLLGAEAKDELGKASKKKKKPAFSKSDAVTSILVSGADKSIYVIQNGDIVTEGKAEIDDPKKKLGSNVFILEKGDEDGFTWQATGYSTGKKAAKPNTSVVQRIKPPADVQAAIDERMKPGVVFITTDQPATPETRSGKDFTVMDSEGK